MSLNEKANTILNFIRASTFLGCAMLTSNILGMDSNACVFFIIIAVTITDVAICLSPTLHSGKPRTMLRGFLFSFTFFWLILSKIKAKTVADHFATAALAVSVACQLYILYLSCNDDKEIEQKS
jgi:hypothetical protein